MHITARENIEFCMDVFLRALPAFREGRELAVLEINGTGEPELGGLVTDRAADSVHHRAARIDGESGLLRPGKQDDELLKARSFDLVIVTRALGASPIFWDSFADLVQLCRTDGLVLVIEPSAGPWVNKGTERFRFLAGAMGALARWSRTALAWEWNDERGPWRDSIGVFCRDATLADKLAAALQAPVRPDLTGQTLPPRKHDEEERCAGEKPYLAVLKAIHESLKPSFYLEIGVRFGKSASLARCDSLGIDPYPEPLEPLPEQFQLAATTSDAWFRTGGTLPKTPDLAFIDGCHWWEYALRDFMHIEREARPGSLIVIDDIYPNNRVQAQRQRETVAWTGDVWKLHDCLARHRPDLWLLPLDTFPTGLLLVSACDPDNRVLWNRYGQLIRDYSQPDYAHPPESRLKREDAHRPDTERLETLMSALGELRGASCPGQVREGLDRAWAASADKTAERTA